LPAPLIEQIVTFSRDCELTNITDAQFQQVATYCELLWEWNQKINLTRHTTAELFVHRDLLDSFRLSKFLKADETVLDFGSGSGVPGIVLSILRPDIELSLCESVQKKARVLSSIVKSMSLPIDVFDINVTKVLEDRRYGTLTARAVGSLSKMATWLEPHWRNADRLLTIKGPSWVDERAEARHVGLLSNLNLRKLDEYNVPGHDGASVILQLAPKHYESASA
jgi:16S rRNA (guanine527-N7)-methyltransferase